ncbi:MAG: hypothetical protein ACSHWY_06775 [Octadecabacter sp.]
MPRKTPKPRTSAGKSPASRTPRRKVSPKQAHDRNDLARHGRSAPRSVKPMKFPGKLGGR